ncbi:hypothetical protein, partial [Pseudomonas costantinii]|uniref:hypothetical protein n=1 Tax=Pseudomonas costantinii TaxID=168469 RepID=UPI001C431C7E
WIKSQINSSGCFPDVWRLKMWKRACSLPHVLPLLIYTTQVGFQAAVLLILILILGAPLNHAGRK